MGTSIQAEIFLLKSCRLYRAVRLAFGLGTTFPQKAALLLLAHQSSLPTPKYLLGVKIKWGVGGGVTVDRSDLQCFRLNGP